MRDLATEGRGRYGLLHEGLLRIEGDAEAELRFFDAQGKLITDPFASGPGSVTHSGSSTGTHASLSAEAAGVLRAMGVHPRIIDAGLGHLHNSALTNPVADEPRARSLAPSVCFVSADQIP